MLTDLERQGIQGILNSDYMDGSVGDAAIDRPVWTWSANPFQSARIFAGVVSSLVQKGYVQVDHSGPSRDHTIWVTRAGMDAYRATCPATPTESAEDRSIRLRYAGDAASREPH